jgi:hypothetical protein
MTKWIAIALLAAPVAALAQPAPDEAAFEDIVVEGVKSPYRLTPKQLREGVAAFAADRASLAPAATLRFKVFRYTIDPALRGVRFRLLADNGDAFPIELGEDGSFTLPAIDFDKQGYALQANRKAGNVRVSPLILSPGSTESDRRLGDLRLFCSVGWAMMRQSLSVAVRAMVGTVGGLCASSKIGAYFQTEKPLASGRVVASGAVTPISIRTDGSAFRYPGYIKSLSNDARVILEYR